MTTMVDEKERKGVSFFIPFIFPKDGPARNVEFVQTDERASGFDMRRILRKKHNK